jgi:hypothetical protein
MTGEECIHLFVVLEKSSVKGSLEEAESSHSLLQYLAGKLESSLASLFNRPRRAVNRPQGELAHLPSIFPRPRINRSQISTLGWSSPPQQGSPELAPTTISERRCHQ